MAQPEVKEEGRIRTLTERGQEQYDETKVNFQRQIQKAWTRVQETLEALSDSGQSDIETNEANLHKQYADFNKLSMDFIEFLNETRTKESQSDRALVVQNRTGCEAIYTAALTQIKLMKNIDAKSSASGSSRKSRMQAKLDAMQVKMKLAEEEAEIQKKRARIIQMREEEELNAQMNLLKIKKEAAELEAEAKAEASDEEVRSQASKIQLPVDNDRTERFVNEHFNDQTPPTLQPPAVTNPQMYSQNQAMTCNAISTGSPNIDLASKPPQQAEGTQNNVASEFTCFLLKKELLMTSLTTFDEKPEHYAS